MTRKLLHLLLIIYTFLVPFQTRMFLIDSGVEYQRVTLYGTQILFALIVIIFIILEAKRKFEIRSTKSEKISDIKYPISKWPFTNHYSLITLVVLFIAIQFISSSRIDLSIQTLLWITQTMLFIWIVRREKLERMVLWIFVASMCAQSVFIWIQMFTQYIPAFKWLGLAEQLPSVGGVSVVETSFGRFLRGYGTFPHPNIAGGYLLIAIIVLSHITYHISHIKKELMLRVTCYVLCALLVSALVLTFSRSAMLGLIVFIVIEFILSFRSFIRNPEIINKQKQTVIASSDVASERGDLTKAENRQGKIASSQSLLAMTIFILLVFITIAIQFRELTFPRTNISYRLESKSVVERRLYSDQAKEIIKNNLWFGTGLGNYTVALQHRHPDRPAYEYHPPHNVVFLILGEMGIVIPVLALFVIWIWFRIRYPRRRTSSLRGGQVSGIKAIQQIVSQCSMLPLLSILFFDHYLWSLYSGWVLVGIVPLSFIVGFGTMTTYKTEQNGL